MSGDDALDLVERAGRVCLLFGRGWMTAPATGDRARSLGLPLPFGFWTSGRAGVLGDVDADIAAAAIGFMSPQLVEENWRARPADLDPYDVAIEYADAAAAWGRDRLAGIDDAAVERLLAHCDAVIDGAIPSTSVLFAGWRLVPRPPDPRGSLTVALQVLRELRGGAHLAAVHAVGLGPLGSIMSTDDPIRAGESWATRFGWTAPFPEPDRARRAEAERLTSVACAPAFAAIDAADRSDFLDLIGRVEATLD